MQANGSGMISFDPWKGLLLFLLMLMSAMQIVNAQSYDITITVDPDCWGNETYWELEESDGDLVSSTVAGDYSYSTPNGPGEYTHTISVTDGETYTFTIYDSWGDGMTGSDYYSCNVDGDFEITSGSVVIVDLDDPDFGSSDAYNFTVNAGCTDSGASNYDSTANVDDSSCTYPPPTAGFTYATSTSGCGSATIAFTNTSTLATSYSWTFQNGTPASSTDTDPSVVFPTGGTYKVTLTATNSGGSGTTEQDVTIALDEDGEIITFVLDPDCWGSEIYWELLDADDNTVASVAAGEYPDEFPEYTTTERHSFCLTDQCYTFNIYDTWSDGLEGDSYWSCDEDGTYSFEDSAGNTILTFDDDPDYGASNQETFCTNYTYVWTGTFDDDWQNSGNWVDGAVPSSQHSVRIEQTNYAPNLNETVTIEKMHITSGSALEFANGSGKLKLENDLIVEGTIDASKGLILMQGDHHVYIKGDQTPTFYKLKINSTDSVTLLTDAKFRGPIIPTKGVFDFNDQEVTLISEENYTGSIGEIKSNAEIIGDTITMERYFPAASGSWRMLCTPITSATFEQWNDDIPTTGFTGSDYPNYPSASNPWSNVRYYDETYSAGDASHIDSGFVSISNITDLIGNEKGYFVYMVPGPTTIDVTGTWMQGDDNQDLDFTESNTDDFNDGWNLVANPYPSAIDWDDGPGWTKQI